MKKKNKKFTFIDIEFHKKTKSGFFLFNLISDFYETNFLWVKSQNKKFIFNYKKKNLKKNLFFFQFLPNIRELLTLRNKNLFWAPMYDDIKNKNYFFWLIVSFFNIRVISFSRRINKLCKIFKIKFIYLKYFPDIKKKYSKLKKKKISIFFWYRGTVKLYDWINSIDPEYINEIIYFNLKDPAFKNEKIKNEDKIKYKIKFYYGRFGKKDKIYKSLVDKCDVYVAPREREGIGHSFLEAMAKGKYILSKNEETMNEYILSKKIGNYFEQKMQIENILNYRYERYKNALKLSNNWNKKKIKLINFLKK